ncbi:recombination protein NinB [Acidovorax sp. Be4]|uniref:Recombination protein NinB n=1 Tax=Acidovorax bellezanensis TaxID=2976702 RepID=A0ABT2PPP7_9BURK|nr:recombination protein NinB [Acidovorax sp. Be4]MCT9812436.1 recombination protein NinB [Acidovorax sp. Be4]
MTDRLEIELHNRAQAWALIQGQLYPFLKSVLQGGGRWVLTVTRRKRTPKQNRRYWGGGVLAQIAAQATTAGGRMYSTENWHEVFKQMFIGVEELPNGNVVGKSSTGLTTVEFSEFCTQVEAYAATQLGVTFYDLWEGN